MQFLLLTLFACTANIPNVETDAPAPPQSEFIGLSDVCGDGVSTRLDGVIATGISAPSLIEFDNLAATIINQPLFDVSQASLAVMKNGRLVHARGYRDLNDTRNTVEIDTRFRVASISKFVTGITIQKIIEEGLLSEDDLLVDFVSFVIPDNVNTLSGLLETSDPRLSQITIRDLLHHRGGWDRSTSFDAMFRESEISKALGLSRQIKQADIISYMAAIPLDFDPGSQYAYSNFGYMLLGKIVEEVTGRDYESYVQTEILSKLGISNMQWGLAITPQPNEARYNPTGLQTLHAMIRFENFGGHGRWIASATDIVQMAHHFRHDSAPQPVIAPSSIDMLVAPHPRENSRERYYASGTWISTQGESRTMWHTGLLHTGSSSIYVSRHDGLTWALLLNGSKNSPDLDLNSFIDSELHEAADSVTSWPEYDLRVACP